MIKIDVLFDIIYGQKEYHSKSFLKEKKNGTPLITAKTTDNGVSGYFDIEPIYENCISLSVVGENSCTALFQKNKCCINDNCLVLKPKIKLTDNQMLYYCTVISMNKDLFPAYGRNVTPQRLSLIKIPNINEIPSWVDKVQLIDLSHLKDKFKEEETPDLKTEAWKEFKLYPDIFEMEAGKYYPSTSFSDGDIPLISSTDSNNGTTKFTDLNPTYNGNCITIGKVVCSTYYQKKPFCATADATVLVPKININEFSGLFIASVISKETFRWNYGRQIRLNNCKDLVVKLPAKEVSKGVFVPDVEFMEHYIKTLHFTKNI